MKLANSFLIDAEEIKKIIASILKMRQNQKRNLILN
jgi:hypothetical protein